MKKSLKFIALAIMIIMVLPTVISAATPYATYTYSSEGFTLSSPAAYVPDKAINSTTIGLATAFDDPRDLEVDDQNNVYLVDAANSRVIIMDRYFKQIGELAGFVNDQGVSDTLANPSGVFINQNYIYVCDTDNNRIIMYYRNELLDEDGEVVHEAYSFYKVVPKPESDLFTEGSIYKPVAMAVDQYGRLFVVSSTTYQGIIVMSDDGEFQGFIGAQKVTIGALEIIWRELQTDEQREYSEEYVSTEFNNITIDKDGFIYVTTSSIDEAQQQNAINNKDKSGDFAPVKKLNATGADIMRRNGFYPPSGEVGISNLSTMEITGASKIIDVAVGPEGTWSIIDEKRQKVFTYDSEGNMLHAFGDKGMQFGNIQSIEAVVYQDNSILVLDKTADNITVFKRTQYGDILVNALANQNARKYDMAVDDWTEILKRNSNFDAAYIGIGKALARSADYDQAMEYFKFAYDTENYSDSFREVRKEWASKFFWIIPVVIIVLCILVAKFFGYAKKVNDKTALVIGRKSLKQEVLYGFHLIFHPFDGFWDLKHEQRGSVRGAIIYVAIAIFTFFYQSVGTGYIFNPNTSAYMNIFAQVTSVMVPLLLWVVANWCLTTLFDGEGSFKDIFIATSYSLLPIPLLMIPSTLLTNFLAINEGQIVTLLNSIAFYWVGMLIFFGMMVTHDYSLGKNILTSLGTIVGMAFIMFVGVLFSSLLAKIISFISSLIIEITYRM